MRNVYSLVSKTLHFTLLILVGLSIFVSSCKSTKETQKTTAKPTIETLNPDPLYVLEMVLLETEAVDPDLSEEEKKRLIEENVPDERRFILHDDNTLALVVLDPEGIVTNHVVFNKSENIYKIYENVPIIGASYNVMYPDKEFPPEAIALIEDKLVEDGLMKIEKEKIEKLHGYNAYPIVLDSPDFGKMKVWTTNDFPKGEGKVIPEILHFQHMLFLESEMVAEGLRVRLGAKEKKVDESMRKYLSLDENTYK